MVLFDRPRVGRTATFGNHCLDNRSQTSLTLATKRTDSMFPVLFQQICLIPDVTQLFVRGAERNDLGKKLSVKWHQGDLTKLCASHVDGSAKLRRLRHQYVEFGGRPGPDLDLSDVGQINAACCKPRARWGSLEHGLILLPAPQTEYPEVTPGEFSSTPPSGCERPRSDLRPVPPDALTLKTSTSPP